MSLLNFIKTHPEMRRIFGKKELQVIEKQLQGISLTQSEKNRLSRDIRKKFEIIKELSHLSNEFDIKKGAEIKEIIEETKEIILSDELSKKIKRIILYGSVVSNEIAQSSDIDVAVEFTAINEKEALLFRKRILGKTNERIDVQVFNVLPEKIKKSMNERVLYERKN